MEKIRPDVTIQEAVKEAQEDPDICGIVDPYERAEAIATWLDREYPFAWMIETRQNAAARAVGVPSQKELMREYRAIEAEDAGRAWVWETELTKLGLSLLGVSGVLVVGELWAGALGCAITGIAILALRKSP